MRSACVAALLGIAAVLPVSASAQEAPDISAFAAADEPPAFDTPEAAVETFRSALTASDTGPLARLLGLDPARLGADENSAPTFAALREGAARQLLVADEGDRRLLRVGAKLWTLPFPLVKGSDGRWAFDTYAGLEEIVNRRVGENELEAIATARAYVEAQKDYASEDRDDDGVLEYAQKLISSVDATDGLYWPADPVHGESPAGPAIDQDRLDGAAGGDGYFGYRFKVLAGQGDNIAGDAYDYVINGNMIGGFALLAWPVRYAETGVKTFAVNQHGIVYEADLGPATGQIAVHIDRFNPDESWSVVHD
jgi:hypothetical protein